MKKITALNYFGTYLGVTENWAYKMLLHVPDAKIVIASKCYLKNDFYPSDFEYLRIPGQSLFDLNSNNRILSLAALSLRELLGLFYADLLSIRLRTRKVNLLHSHYTYYAWDVRSLANKLGIPHVVSLYGFDYERLLYRYPVWRKRYQTLFKLADAFLCEGNHGKSILVKMGCPEAKIFTYKLGVEVDQIPYYQRQKKVNELKLVQIARMTEKKGHIYTIRAFIQALQRCPEMELTLVGADIEGIKKQIIKELKGASVIEKVKFVDSIDYKQLYQFMKDYHVFIQPSCYAKDRDCEGGAPVVLLDAQATGMPVISTTHCDIPDEVLDGKTGILCPERDVDTLTNAIEQFYKMDSPEYEDYSRRARAHVEENYNVSLNAVRLREIYEEVLNRRAATQSIEK